MASFSSLRSDVFSREHKRQHYGSYIKGLSAYDRHKKFMDDYVHFYPATTSNSPSVAIKTDMDTLRETYRFIRTEEDDSERTWEQRLAKRYYDKLFKEYCIADMTRYKESKVPKIHHQVAQLLANLSNKYKATHQEQWNAIKSRELACRLSSQCISAIVIGFRWRTEKEVVSGKGQFICGNRKCSEKEGLTSYEVNFSYKESGENRQALVKLRVCPRCAYKLKYRKEKELENQLREEKRKARKRQRKEKTERRSKKRRTSIETDEDISNEEGSSSRSDVSKSPNSSEQKTRKSRGVPSTSSTGGPPQQPGRNDEFDQYFEGMFL